MTEMDWLTLPFVALIAIIVVGLPVTAVWAVVDGLRRGKEIPAALQRKIPAALQRKRR